MGDKAKTNGISLSEDDWVFVDQRGSELKLNRAKARSLYFQMLVDLDRKMRFAKHPHHADGEWHLYEENQATYPGTILPAEEAVREELDRRTHPHQPPTSVSERK